MRSNAKDTGSLAEEPCHTGAGNIAVAFAYEPVRPIAAFARNSPMPLIMPFNLSMIPFPSDGGFHSPALLAELIIVEPL